MTSYAPLGCRYCRADIVLETSAKTGRKIRLNPVPAPEGTFAVSYEAGKGRVARFVPKDMREGKKLWVAHAATCTAVAHPPRRIRPQNLTLDLAGNEGTPAELAIARTQAHNAELQLERLADELIKEWREKCRRDRGWSPVWNLLQPFLARRGGELAKPLREKLSAVVGRRLHPAAARAGDRSGHQYARAER